MKEDLIHIFQYYGVRNQLRKFNEEVFELIEAIIDYECVDVYKGSSAAEKYHKEYIVEEIADVQVLLDQLQHYFEIEDKDIVDMIQFKVDRQLDRIKREKVTLQEKSDLDVLQ